MKTRANHISGAGLVSLLYKEQLKFNRKAKSPILKWAKDLNRHFSQDIQVTNKHMKRSSARLVTKEMQIKTTMRYH